MARGLRVIAGEAGGLRLVSPPNARPTTDRVREALFSALGDRVHGASVLDLYAGSGALAIEALSRGASRAVLVDRDRESELACEHNLEATGFADRARFVRKPISTLPTAEPWPDRPFDLVFCDPPYTSPDAELAIVLGNLSDSLAEGAIVVVERPAPMWTPPEGWTASWQRKYGDTLMTIIHASD
jgi:16S rRNA (guanine966-N2)-methyltransferase